MTEIVDMETDLIESAGPSKRARVKSQRALESEQTDRLFARARAQERGIASGLVDPQGSSSHASASKTGVKAPRGRKGVKKSVVEYCICKTDGEEGTPMIECGICNDWFHFFCIHLTENEAEKIHKFVCSGCEIRTGEKTTHIYDVELYTSPPPTPGFDGLIPLPKATKRPSNVRQPFSTHKRAADYQKPKQKRKSIEPSSSAESSSDSGSEAVIGNSSDSSKGSASVKVNKPKRPRIAPARSSLSNAVEKKLPQRKASATQLQSTRAHVIKPMTEVMSGFFGDAMSGDKVEVYAGELEQGLWEDRKELVNGKEAPGAKYKTQFNLLASSLSRPIREELRESILNFTLPARQVAQLTSVDLATLERIKELEAAKHAVLAQTVKAKEDGPAAIRLGRDGLERAEDNREKEMKAIQAAEEKARDREERRLSLIDSPTPGPAAETGEKSIPTEQHDSESKNAIHTETAARGSTSAGASPVRSSIAPRESPMKPRVSIASAWGATDGEKASDEVAPVVADQTQIDLSDMDFGTMEEVDFTSEDVNVKDDDPQQVKPVVWSGNFWSGAEDKMKPVRAVVQHASASATPINWPAFLPHQTVLMTGRIPVDKSLPFLSSARLSPSKELVAITMSLHTEATDEERSLWNDIANDYLERGRHGIYKPYGKQPSLPGKCNELYMIPLRPDATPPDETELIDGFSVPSNRKDTIYIGVFVTVRESTPSNAPSRPSITAPRATPLPAPTPTPLTSAPTPGVTGQSAAPVVPNERLAELMASLPASILGPPPSGHSPLQGGQSPAVPASAAGITGYTTPQGYYPAPSVPAYTGHGDQGAYNAYPASYGGYQAPMGYYEQGQHAASQGGYDDRRHGQPGGWNDWERNNPGKRGRGDNRFDGRERDNGWENRTGAGGYGR